jgi:predicted nucleic-acid-binding protein
MVRTKSCYVTLEVMAEVCYVLEGLYQVSREDIISCFLGLKMEVA